MIEVKNITKKYGSKIVLNDFSVAFLNNKINIIWGPSGCGKTTLFNIISGLDKGFSGSVINIPKVISYLFQEDRLLPYFTAVENVMFTLPDSITDAEKYEISVKNLENLELSTELNAYPHQLSGGMLRRVAIARAFSHPSQLMLMDEPFNGLNIELKKVVASTLENHLTEQGKNIIVITHDLSPFEDIGSVNIIDVANYK